MLGLKSIYVNKRGHGEQWGNSHHPKSHIISYWCLKKNWRVIHYSFHYSFKKNILSIILQIGSGSVTGYVIILLFTTSGKWVVACSALTVTSLWNSQESFLYWGSWVLRNHFQRGSDMWSSEALWSTIINSFRPCDAYMHCVGPSLVQIMACCLWGTKPLSEPVLEYC